MTDPGPSLGMAGRTAIVTGAGGSIGSATARIMAREGLRLVLTDQAVDRLEATAAECRAAGVDVVAVGADLADRDLGDRLVEAAMEAFGSLNIVVCIAATWTYTRLDEITDETWADTLDINAGSALRLCRAAAPAMMSAGGGAITTVSSGVAFRPLPTVGAYAASKAALTSLSRTLAIELGPTIRVNIVSPGVVERLRPTGGAGEIDPNRSLASAAAANSPLGRIGRPEEIGEVVAFLCSDRASYMTGATIHVNGGSLIF